MQEKNNDGGESEWGQRIKTTTATLNRHTQQSAATGEITVTVFAAFPDGLNTVQTTTK